MLKQQQREQPQKILFRVSSGLHALNTLRRPGSLTSPSLVDSLQHWFHISPGSLQNNHFQMYYTGFIQNRAEFLKRHFTNQLNQFGRWGQCVLGSTGLMPDGPCGHHGARKDHMRRPQACSKNSTTHS